MTGNDPSDQKNIETSVFYSTSRRFSFHSSSFFLLSVIVRFDRSSLIEIVAEFFKRSTFLLADPYSSTFDYSLFDFEKINCVIRQLKHRSSDSFYTSIENHIERLID